MTFQVEKRAMDPSRRSESLGLSGIREIFEKAQRIKDVIRLEFGEPDFDTPDNIKQAAIRAISQGKTKYTSSSGLPELRVAISSKLESENGVRYEPSNEIVVGAGATSAIFAALFSTLDNGDEILVPNPGWATYVHAVKLSGASPVPYSLREENEYRFVKKEVQDLVTSRTKAILINSPSNPIGSIFDEKDIKNIADFAIENDLFVLSDEVYEKFLYEDAGRNDRHVSIASLPEMKDRTVTINAFSKTYAMTGWRIGYAAASKEIAGAISKVNAAANSCVSTIAQYAAIEALTGSQDSVPRMIEAFKKRRELLVRSLNEMDGVTCAMPRGAFYAFPNIRQKKVTSKELAMRIVEEGHVAVVPGSAFGSEGEGYIRMAYANSLENIEKAIDRISEIMRAV